MPITKARRHELLLAWIGLAFLTSTSVVLEMMLLAERGPLVAVITAALALLVGMSTTRRALTPHKRAAITVGALRERARYTRSKSSSAA